MKIRSKQVTRQCRKPKSETCEPTGQPSSESTGQDNFFDGIYQQSAAVGALFSTIVYIVVHSFFFSWLSLRMSMLNPPLFESRQS